MIQELALLKDAEERKLYREVYVQSLKNYPNQTEGFPAGTDARVAVLRMRDMFNEGEV